MATTPIDLRGLQPPLGTDRFVYMLEPVSFRARVAAPPEAAGSLEVQLWTNTVHGRNPEGLWHAIPLRLSSRAAEAVIYGTTLRPTATGDFQFTFRWRAQPPAEDRAPAEWSWAGEPGGDGRLQVAPPDPQQLWTQGPRFAWIHEAVGVGNLLAAGQAAELGFQAVLNLAEEFPEVLPPGHRLSYRHIPLRDGADHPIDPADIAAAVSWLEERIAGGEPTLVNCRAGIGRSGSIGVALIYARHRHWPYRDALEHVWAHKPDVYPHRGLEASLPGLFPRRRPG